MQYNTYTPDVLKRRSELATSLRFEPEVEKMAKATAEAAKPAIKSIPFPAGLAPVLKPVDPAPNPNDSLPRVDVIAMMDIA